jgi:hypothetical protein
MKTMKVALLASAALAAVSVSARADDTAAIKAQLEALTARIAQLEATPALPAGYQLMSISRQDSIVIPGLDADRQRERGATAITIGVVPAADMPASTVIQWAGSVRAALAYRDVDFDSGDESADYPEGNQTHIFARARLDVTGTTDTAVGEVGAAMSFFTDFDVGDSTNVLMDYAWGWWKMTPELTFAGGYNGSLATIGYGTGAINDAYVSRGGTRVDGDDFTQLRLTWESGPLALSVALEHTDEDGNAVVGVDPDGSPLGVAAELAYKGDAFSAEVAGYLRDAVDPNTGNSETGAQLGAGVLFGLSDMIALSAAGSFGSNVLFDDADGDTTVGDGWEVSAAAVVTLSDTVSAELGVGMSEYEDESGPQDETDVLDVIGGVYWSPVSQLKMGAQASWQNREDDFDELDDFRAAFVTWWNFAN